MLWELKLGTRFCRGWQGVWEERIDLHVGLETCFTAAGIEEPEAAWYGWDKVEAGDVGAAATHGILLQEP